MTLIYRIIVSVQVLVLVIVIVSVCSASASVVSIEGRVLVNNKIKACSNDRGKELGIIN